MLNLAEKRSSGLLIASSDDDLYSVLTECVDERAVAAVRRRSRLTLGHTYHSAVLPDRRYVSEVNSFASSAQSTLSHGCGIPVLAHVLQLAHCSLAEAMREIV